MLSSKARGAARAHRCSGTVVLTLLGFVILVAWAIGLATTLSVETVSVADLRMSREKDVAAEVPKKDVVAEVPTNDVAAEVPKKDVAAEVSMKDVAAEVPKKGVAAEVPKKHVAAEVPKKRAVSALAGDHKQPFCAPTVQPAYNHSAWLDMYLERVAAMKPWAPCPDCFADEKVGKADLEVSKAKACSRWWDPNPLRPWEHSPSRVPTEETVDGAVIPNCPFGQEKVPRTECSPKLEEFFTIMNDMGVMYHPTDGTELGVVRQSSYLSKDGDIDLFIDFPLNKLLPAVKHLGARLTHGDGSRSDSVLSINLRGCPVITAVQNDRYVGVGMHISAPTVCRCFFNSVEMRCHAKGGERMYTQYGPSWRLSLPLKKADEPRFCFGSNPQRGLYGWCTKQGPVLEKMRRGKHGLITEEAVREVAGEQTFSKTEMQEILAHLNIFIDGYTMY